MNSFSFGSGIPQPDLDGAALCPKLNSHFVFSTSNKNKLAEIQAILGGEECLMRKITTPEFQPEKEDWAKVDRLGAIAYHTLTVKIAKAKAIEGFNQALLSSNPPDRSLKIHFEDAGLYLDYQLGRPGPLVSSFDHLDLRKQWCKEAYNVGSIGITAVIAYSTFSGVGEPLVFCAESRGVMPREPQGSDRFSWDDIFGVVDGSLLSSYGIVTPDMVQGKKIKTWAEMDLTEKNLYSPRPIALRTAYEHFRAGC